MAYASLRDALVGQVMARERLGQGLAAGEDQARRRGRAQLPEELDQLREDGS